MHRVVGIIPARYNSTRFPGKPLALLKGKPIIQHVYEQVRRSASVDKVCVATDDERIYNSVVDFGGEVVMTSADHMSGTDRVAEVARDLDCDIVVNIQGDEPFIRPEMINDVVGLLSADERASIGTLAKRITDSREIFSPDVVKVVIDDDGFALYFSRAPIPYHRDGWSIQIKDYRTRRTDPGAVIDLQYHLSTADAFHCYKHIGLYAYRRDALLRFAALPSTGLEEVERLEQLRALVAGMKIRVKETIYDTLGIDTIEDLKRAEEWQSTSL